MHILYTYCVYMLTLQAENATCTLLLLVNAIIVTKLRLVHHGTPIQTEYSVLGTSTYNPITQHFSLLYILAIKFTLGGKPWFQWDYHIIHAKLLLGRDLYTDSVQLALIIMMTPIVVSPPKACHYGHGPMDNDQVILGYTAHLICYGCNF